MAAAVAALPLPPKGLLVDALAGAHVRRRDFLRQMDEEVTDAYRLFHGSAEGQDGLTVDRYGEILLVQSFHQSLSPEELAIIEAFFAEVCPGLISVYNDRSRPNSRVFNLLDGALMKLAEQPREFRELGVKYRFKARHAGQDPWLFLDLRAGRRRVMNEARGKSVLNVFSYTCGVGIVAASFGASQVINIDHADSNLAIGKENAGLNNIPISVRFIKSDAFAALRQYSGIGQPQVVRRKKLPDFPKLDAQQFDLVFLDPPRYAKSAFGVVDLVNDYPALFKPALLATTEGGTIICCNNVAQVDRSSWLDQLDRCARKAGRPIRETEWIMPEPDFPSPDGQPPLKVVLLRV